MKALPEDNYISICEEKCVFDSTSSSSVAKCKLPKLPTAFSDEQFAIATPVDALKGSTFGSAGNHARAFDGSLTATYSDSKVGCHVGIKFKEGHVGLISQVKYYMPWI